MRQFSVEGYTVYRNDYTEHTAVLMMFIRDALPQRRRYDLEEREWKSGRIETTVTELTIFLNKWLIHSVYKQPIVKDIQIQSIIESILCNCQREGVNYIICGDLNIKMLKSNSLNVFQMCMDVIFLLQNQLILSLR